MKSINQLIDLSDKVALITGGAGHLGMAMAGALAENGAQIVLLDLDRTKVDTQARLLREKYGVNAFGVSIDLENEEMLQSVPNIVESDAGSLDILINNAAFVGTSDLKGWAVPLAEQSLETWKRAFDVNLAAVFELTKRCEPLMSRSDCASVINIASIYGMLGPDLSLYNETKMGNPAAYAASKGGLLQLTRWLATVLAPKIRVNAITPGGVERGQPEVFKSRYIEKVPLQRMAEEDDFKGAALFLASEMSKYVTGQNIVVDGGFSVW